MTGLRKFFKPRGEQRNKEFFVILKVDQEGKLDLNKISKNAACNWIFCLSYVLYIFLVLSTSMTDSMESIIAFHAIMASCSLP